MKKFRYFIIFLLAFGFITVNLYAKISVESAKGEAAYKKGNEWLPLTKGMALEEGTKISTGIRSWAQINIDGNIVRIEQLTMIKISRNKLTAGSRDTQIALKHGSLKARIAKIGTLKTSFKITTPVATSSVRGTEEIVSYGPDSGMTIRVIEGTIEGGNSNGVLNFINGNSVFHLGPNDPRPDNLLTNLINGALPQIYDPNITDDENASNEYNGFNTINPNDNPGDFVPLVTI